MRAVGRGRAVLPCWGIDLADPSPQGFACRCRLGASCKRPGKHPHIAKPYENATRSAARVHKWALRWPAANWAWIPGRSSHADIDVDNRRAGDEALYALESTYGPLPDTERVITGDGVHITFKVPATPRLAAQELAPGIELKTGPTSYVILPGSIHHAGARYEYEVGYEPGAVAIAELPQWLLELPASSTLVGPLPVPRGLRGFSPRNAPELDRTRLEALLSPGQHLGRLWNHDESIRGDRSATGWDYKLLLALHRAGYDLPDAIPVLAEHRRLHGSEDAILYRECRRVHDPAKVCGTEYALWTWAKALGYATTATPQATPLRRVERAQGLTAAFDCTEAVFNAGGTAVHILALEILSTFAKSGSCYMARGTMAEQLHCTPRNAGYVLAFLAGRGFIRQAVASKRDLGTIYHLTFLED